LKKLKTELNLSKLNIEHKVQGKDYVKLRQNTGVGSELDKKIKGLIEQYKVTGRSCYFIAKQAYYLWRKNCVNNKYLIDMQICIDFSQYFMDLRHDYDYSKTIAFKKTCKKFNLNLNEKTKKLILE
jgi:hypothetical protein